MVASTPQERFDALNRISAEIITRKDELGRLLAREEGKTLPEGIGEVARAPPAEVVKAGRMLSPERMRIVLDSLTEVPILYHAATKAGIHRKTLEYWLRRSAAGDAGYDIEWQGMELRFHEHCASAIDEADDSLRAVMWQSAMGVVSKTDENGNFISEACGQPNMKVARHFLEWQLPEKYGKRRKRPVPHNAGVLVIGGDVTKKPEYDTTASVKARKWKSFSRKFREAKT